MHRPRSALFFPLVSALLFPANAAALTPTDAASLWQQWPTTRLVTTAAPCLRHLELEDWIATLVERHPERIRTREIGTSVEGRAIHLLEIGSGHENVLLWSQMHGDEPSATPAVLDLLDWLANHADDQGVATILERLTIVVIPMLNPDGAERYTRQNAQGIDINRDALALATPEGRLLKQIRDRYQPILGFNLHDQNRRRTVGSTGVLASTSVLAVTGDEAQTWTPGRLLAKRASAAIATTLEPFTPGGIGRFDATWSPRAFGDNLTAWGTPVVLIESGGPPVGGSFEDLTRLNFVALATVLHDLARDRLAGHDPDRYDLIPENSLGDWVDVEIVGGRVLQPSRLEAGPSPSYEADVSFDLLGNDRALAGCSSQPARSRFVELGDGSTVRARRQVDASGMVLIPAFEVGTKGWSARRWLDREGLERLAALGVARVSWQVPPRRLAAAVAHARAVEGSGRPSLEPTVAEIAPSVLQLRRLPPALTVTTLADVTTALGLTGGNLGAVLPQLAGSGRQGVDVVIRPGAEASFLLLRTPDAAPETAHPERLPIDSIWIDGREVGGRGPGAGDRGPQRAGLEGQV